MNDWDDISPGIRELVIDLNDRGYETTDSGDGSNFEEGLGCALPYRHVFGVLPKEANMVEEADKLARLYPAAKVEVSYSPGESVLFMVFPDGYETP